MRLEKGMYCGGSRLFGLQEGAMKTADFVHNGGWFNTKGEKLGWGDLSITDIQRIAECLQEGELFLILSERDSYWDHVKITTEGNALVHNVDKEAEMSQGQEHMIECTRYAIAPGKVYAVKSKYSPLDWKPGPSTIGDHRTDEALNVENIDREQFAVLVKA